MPFGTTWPRYLTFVTCCFLTMFAGSEVVHRYYNPLKDFDEYVEKQRHKSKV